MSGLCVYCASGADCSLAGGNGKMVVDCLEYNPANGNGGNPALEKAKAISGVLKAVCGECAEGIECSFYTVGPKVLYCEEYR